MAPHVGNSLKEVAQRFNGEVFALVRLAPGMVLAVDAAQGAMGKEEGPGAAFAADGGFLPEVRAMPEETGGHASLAIAELACHAVGPAGARAQRAVTEL